MAFFRSNRVFTTVLWVWFLSAGALAQTPSRILLAKAPSYRQTSSTTVTFVSAGFGAQVAFSGVPAMGVSVQLQGPGGAGATLQRQTDGSFEFSREFADIPELNRTFPDGTYTISVSGGASTSNVVVTLATTNITPVLITNFDALQSWPFASAVVNWQPITGVRTSDLINLTVTNASGATLYDNGPNTSALTTGLSTGPLPFLQNFTGDLAYFRIDTTTVNSGATVVSIVGGFDVEFSLRCVPAAPIVKTQPTSAVAHVGSMVSLQVEVAGQGLSYQLKKNGVPVPGANASIATGSTIFATFALPITQAADAGIYTIDVINASGVTTSAPAMIVVAPELDVTTFAGRAGVLGSSDGAGPAAQFNVPSGIALDSAGNLFVADHNNSTIRKITPTGTVTTFAGAAGQSGSADGAGTAARFFGPSGLGIDRLDNLYVADSGNCTVRKISPAGVVSTIAGAAGQSGAVDGTGSGARFKYPYDVAIDASGNLFVSDKDAHTLRKITPGGVATTFAGSVARSDATDGLGNAAGFDRPAGMAFDPSGNLYVCDSVGLRKVTPTGQVTTVWGGASSAAYVDTGLGNGLNAGSSTDLWDVAIDASGAIYLAEYNAVRRIIPGGTALIMAGGGLNTQSSRPGQQVFLGAVNGIALDAAGNVYLAEANDHMIRKGAFVPGSADPMIAVKPSSRAQTIALGGSVAFSVEATGPGLCYQWLQDGARLRGATGPTLLLEQTTAASAGSYSVLVGNGAGVVNSLASTLAISTTPDVGRLVNLSVRSRAGTGAQTFIVGAVLGGAGTKSLLARAIGPTLSTFGVSGVLANPVLTLMSGTRTVATNDDWGGGTALASAFGSVGAFALAANSLDAALSSTLAPGSYTIQITGGGTGTGVALAELYDLAVASPSASAPRLLNVSTRTLVGTGDDILIAGFVIGGSTSRTLLIRGAGPALASYGVSGVLADPQLNIYTGNTVVASNDNWGGDPALARAFSLAGAFPFSSTVSTDAALVITLPPGGYTAQLAGAGNTTGVALVEVYVLP